MLTSRLWSVLVTVKRESEVPQVSVQPRCTMASQSLRGIPLGHFWHTIIFSTSVQYHFPWTKNKISNSHQLGVEIDFFPQGKLPLSFQLPLPHVYLILSPLNKMSLCSLWAQGKVGTSIFRNLSPFFPSVLCLYPVQGPSILAFPPYQQRVPCNGGCD